MKSMGVNNNSDFNDIDMAPSPPRVRQASPTITEGTSVDLEDSLDLSPKSNDLINQQSDSSDLQRINELVFNNFPLVVNLPSTQPFKSILKSYNLPITKKLKLFDKQLASDIIPKLLDAYKTSESKKHHPIKFDYSNFSNHPNYLFVKNFRKEKKKDSSKIIKYFNDLSLYKSLSDIDYSHNNLILKFDNFLDCEYFLDSTIKHPTNNEILNINRFTKIKRADDTDHDYSILYIDNLSKFLPGDLKRFNKDFSKTFNTILDKFRLFCHLESMYFPIINNDLEFGFIKLHSSDLRILYYLNNLNYQEFMDFSEVPNINDDDDIDDTDTLDEDTIHITIAQHKHNHLLYQFYPQYLSGNSINMNNLNSHQFIINPFLTSTNYQETNIYVTNFPLIFNNDDEIWSKFWSKFGDINSAKIIKPHYYSQNNHTVGKIGFVFFKTFKMCIKAILMTNNKVINLGGANVIIKTSFAIQKLNRHNEPIEIPPVPMDMPFIPVPMESMTMPMEPMFMNSFYPFPQSYGYYPPYFHPS
ncbi:hypothetical protein CLIB1444_04S03444 [[Candida] jaroonii]|uniref:Uncharacterized protein n=1 Tax=[Candida] jaroonii TaxID=467808 RepID=A0ACA9Y6E1_9ASCO|nr:hypothetical protein CLIB1444_04S03444 [[Candida] jaroonii]